MKTFWPEKPCQPSVPNHKGGSTRAVEPPAPPGTSGNGASPQSEVAQYQAPGTRKAVGRGTCSIVFANLSAKPFAGAQGAVGGVTAVPQGVPSAGPPAS